MIRRRTRIAAALAASVLLVAACGDDDSSSDASTAPPASDAPAATTGDTEAPAATTGDTEAPTTDTEAPTTDAPAEGFTVNTDDCVDPDAANAPIEGTIKIGSAMPLTGGVAAAAFAPVADGFRAYIDYANANGLVEGHDIELTIEDDQYSAELTPGAVATQIDAGVHLFAGIIGSPNNAAVRDTLNDECIPQLNALTGSPAWGEVADYPWTTGILVPYTVESKVYASQIAERFPDGATVGLFYVNNEFGQVYADAFKAIADEYNLEIIDEQTIEATDSNPPASQITNLADSAPDVIMAVPLGAGCITFLTELSSAKAQNADWVPETFLTNTCASSLILGAAGPSADGLFTSGNIVDIGDPATDADPEVKAYKDYMASIGKTEIQTTAAAGWTTGEVTVEILRLAAASPEGLTRASIINAVRSIDYVPGLVREGVVSRMNGEEDPFIAESLQVIQYDADTATFTDIGELITEFES